jgi:hypothetical protein
MTKKSSKIKTHTKTRISKKSIKNTKKKVSLLKGGSLFGSTCEPTHKPYFKSLAKSESKCSPIFQSNKNHLNQNKLNQINPNSCLDNQNILRLVRAFNNKHPTDKIRVIRKDLKRTYDRLNQKMMKYCNSSDEICWAKQRFIKDEFGKELFEFNFKPIIPDKWYCNNKEWLNTLDIDNVLHQYQQKYPEFVSLGPTPIDFDYKLSPGQCVTNELCRINMKQLINSGKKYIGVVFNLDNHKNSGSHWIAMFCHIPKKEICYWDSYGYQPPKEVTQLMNKLKRQGDKLDLVSRRKIYSNNSNLVKFKSQKDKKFQIRINNNRHQYKNSECGIYCINFIISMLEGRTFENVTNQIMKDDEMNKLRSKYFLPL